MRCERPLRRKSGGRESRRIVAVKSKSSRISLHSTGIRARGQDEKKRRPLKYTGLAIRTRAQNLIKNISKTGEAGKADMVRRTISSTSMVILSRRFRKMKSHTVPEARGDMSRELWNIWGKSHIRKPYRLSAVTLT